MTTVVFACADVEDEKMEEGLNLQRLIYNFVDI
jgi:hypothetical protein